MRSNRLLLSKSRAEWGGVSGALKWRAPKQNAALHFLARVELTLGLAEGISSRSSPHARLLLLNSKLPILLVLLLPSKLPILSLDKGMVGMAKACCISRGV